MELLILPSLHVIIKIFKVQDYGKGINRFKVFILWEITGRGGENCRRPVRLYLR